MCVSCGKGNIKSGIKVLDWDMGKLWTRYIPCTCAEGIALRDKLKTEQLLTGRPLEFTREEAVRDATLI